MNDKDNAEYVELTSHQYSIHCSRCKRNFVWGGLPNKSILKKLKIHISCPYCGEEIGTDTVISQEL